MKYYKWNVFEKFECIGAECPDTCCAGWAIYVDEESGEYYKKVEGEFGNKLRNSIVVKDNLYEIKLCKDRCPLLTEENLCEIYQKLGKDKMCYTCKNYPRFITDVTADDKFAGFYISCPEVARMILSRKEKVNATVYSKGDNMPLSHMDKTCFEKLMDGMMLSLGIMQYRDFSIQERLRLIVFFNDIYESALKKGENTQELRKNFSDVEQLKIMSMSLADMPQKPLQLTKLLLTICRNLLYFPTGHQLKKISDRVLNVICSCSTKEDEFDLQRVLRHIRTEEYEIQFEQYLTYYLFFHYLKAFPDFEIQKYIAISIYMYCIHACFLALLTEEKGSKLSIEECAQIYSTIARTFEHAEQNIQQLYLICEKHGFTGTSELLTLLV